MFGFKIIDSDDAIVREIIDYAAKEKLALEVGLYRGEESIQRYLGLQEINLNTHLNHNEYSVVKIDEDSHRLQEDIRLSKELGASYAIMHLSKVPMSKRQAYHEPTYTILYNRLAIIEGICAVLDFDIYIENTYENMPFYRELFARIQDFKRIHFCFDIGHARVWSQEHFEDWLVFLKELDERGVKLHFHLHTNRGLADEHLSLVEMWQMGFDANDGIFSDLTYVEMIQALHQSFPLARKIFEVKPQFALQNMHSILDHISM